MPRNREQEERRRHLERSILAWLPYGDPETEGVTVKRIADQIGESASVVMGTLRRLVEGGKVRDAWATASVLVRNGHGRGRHEQTYRIKRYTIAGRAHTRTAERTTAPRRGRAGAE